MVCCEFGRGRFGSRDTSRRLDVDNTVGNAYVSGLVDGFVGDGVIAGGGGIDSNVLHLSTAPACLCRAQAGRRRCGCLILVEIIYDSGTEVGVDLSDIYGCRVVAVYGYDGSFCVYRKC